MEWLVALVVVGLLLLVSASKSMARPIRWAGMAALQVVIGAVLLFFANLVGEMAGFHIPINPITALLAGFLRLPGLLALVVIKLYIVP
ncbi:pro-sigmaK processing inhibitor BofA family protein [Brevibacillus migulae]|uniref:pro-sigmaK processing inhibitor BofA family protein n=1 Tax=Brevibacillus migulae TaxID=1644114 RepID=UPI00106E0C9E|nr:pro-sigmaK processing inhibitor BofA family protein [Brevibacillus migulae]